MGTQSATRWPTELPAMDFAEATSLHTFQADNDRDHPARAVDSTQVKTTDRGLGVHRLVIPLRFGL
jgi:hypothetical protein